MGRKWIILAAAGLVFVALVVVFIIVWPRLGIKLPVPGARDQAGAAPAAAATPTADASTQVAGVEASADEPSQTDTASPADSEPTAEEVSAAGPAARSVTRIPGAMDGTLRKLGNLRAGPSTDFPILAVLEANTTVQVLGITPTQSWTLVVLDDGTQGWVYFGNMILSGSLKDLRQVTPTPIP